MGKKIIFLSTILLFLFGKVLSQQAMVSSGPSLVNTIDWVSTNVVDISRDSSQQIRQKLTYDLENNCECRILIKNISGSGDMRTTSYKFHFGDIDPATVVYELESGLVAVLLRTYNKEKRVFILLDEKEEKTNTLVIYEKEEESARRLIRAFAHIARLCKK